MWSFLVTLWNNSYHETPWWGIAISLAVTIPFALILVGLIIEYPIGFLYALLIWNPDRDRCKRQTKERAYERAHRPDIVEARERYRLARTDMLQTLWDLMAKYPFSSVAEDEDVERMMQRMERLWARKGAWSPYAFWVLWGNQMVIRLHFAEEDSETFEGQVHRLYNDWYAWMVTVGFQPRRTWDSIVGDKVYDFH